MNIKEWIAENIGYRFFGCSYTKRHGPLFDFIESKVPSDFLNKHICDLCCGDGSNTVRVRRIFKPKSIVGYDHNDHCLRRARERGIEARKLDLNKKLPVGELAVFTCGLHHLKDKEAVLKQLVKNFEYIFLCEPIRDLYHALLDGVTPLSEKQWIVLFDEVLPGYILYQYRNNLIVFYRRPR